MMGLRADLEWVLAVAESADSVMTELGFLATPAEAAELRRRLAAQDDLGRLQEYAAKFPEEFGGMYIDQQAGGTVVLLFTGNIALHTRAVMRMAPPGVTAQVRQCTYTEAQLTTLLESLDFAALQADGYDVIGAGLDTIGNVITLEAKSNRPAAKERLEARYDGMLQATIYPLPGAWANVASGDGWRLVAAAPSSGSEAFRVRSATALAEFGEMWQSVAVGEETPLVDFGVDVVFSSGHGIGSTCPEVRLDGVVIDREKRLVFSVTSDPLAPRACTTDLVAAVVFVVAVERFALPASPFTLRLGEERTTCEDCGFQEEIQVDVRP